MDGAGRTILLTGGSGVLGETLLEALTGVEVTCLVHRKPVIRSHVRTVQGDITRPFLGLVPKAFDELVRRTDYIVHSAAMTNFGRPAKVHFDINREGTKRILDLAARAGATVCHISTAFAYADRHVSDCFPTHAYERSKQEAEDLVRSSGLPATIVRPSIIIGDSIDGSMSSFQGFHFLMDFFVRGTMPIPAAEGAMVDVVPRDLVARVVAALAANPGVTGEFWITAGSQALTLRRVVPLWMDHLRRLTGATIKQPRFVDPDIVERLVRPALLPALPAASQMLLSRALDLVKYFNITKPFPSSLGHLAQLVGSPHLPNLELTVIRNVESWVRYTTPSEAPVVSSRTGTLRT